MHIPTATALLSLLSLTTAFPARPSTPDLSRLALPPSALLPPDSSLALKYVTLGVGTQNYTCSPSATAPTPFGAVADLYDVSPLFTSFIGPAATKWLPGLALSFATTGRLHDLPSAVGSAVTPIGRHFFDGTPGVAATVPIFDLSGAAVPVRAVVKKGGNVPAPEGACPGPEDRGAVDWLRLVGDWETGNDGRVSVVYRVETAGGVAPETCEGIGAEGVQVQYATEYWFYGPK
ncbi:hypothetical protein P152DRAFT_167481 [Eremomyces bilateralis CBS 781.70]|uniref:Malate dehydrogenase n=1 Tax=Eremomyces bilateralis CBS 781.70 TaxID=1392243 RepID=A0A6G1FUA0_9PEZI|nr:uncharacterized protein P152DRAFT_167481 [Eremomyces bilateralis CBS 781.70]KAF1809262.1 hypothetical protein P152DRAFT_167481 [Eremomyces bilateralis CBS 781.70]